MASSAGSAAPDRVAELARTFTDPVAFRRWYDDAVVRVYRYVYPRCGGDSGVAEEITQQTFIRAVERRASYEGRASVTTWLMTIARNALTDHYRRTAREGRRHLRLVVAEIDEDVASQPSAIDEREAIVAALGALPASQRAAVVLCYLEGMPVRDAADVLKRSEAATESLLSRAKARLRELLPESADG
ncbi:MAG TPA: RNA polymerase sigma factor [Candidatus Limnocylindrales bacterium]|nr:RNA polymerase sigma factor [Candidatus Limnocylindrales bacterium]